MREGKSFVYDFFSFTRLDPRLFWRNKKARANRNISARSIKIGACSRKKWVSSRIWAFGSRTWVDFFLLRLTRKEKLTRTATIAALNRFGFEQKQQPIRLKENSEMSNKKYQLAPFEKVQTTLAVQIDVCVLTWIRISVVSSALMNIGWD